MPNRIESPWLEIHLRIRDLYGVPGDEARIPLPALREARKMANSQRSGE